MEKMSQERMKIKNTDKVSRYISREVVKRNLSDNLR